jgi:hypothetical protein
MPFDYSDLLVEGEGFLLLSAVEDFFESVL